MDTFSPLSIRGVINQSWEFFKQHYEYLLPFSLLYFLVQSPAYFIDSPYVTLPLTIILLPLSLSIAYYANEMLNGEEKKFKLFFDPVHFFLKIIIINLIKFFVVIVLLFIILIIAVLVVGVDSISSIDFITINEQLKNATITPQEILSRYGALKPLMGFLGFGFLLLILIMPFFTFPEYFAVLDGHSVIDSFKLSFSKVADNYLKIFLSFILVSIAMIFIALFTCGLGLIFILPMAHLVYYFIYRNISGKADIAS